MGTGNDLLAACRAVCVSYRSRLYEIRFRRATAKELLTKDKLKAVVGSQPGSSDARPRDNHPFLSVPLMPAERLFAPKCL